MNNEEQHAWDRQPGESSKGYHYFCLYRDMGQDRSLCKLAREDECRAKVGQLERWSSKWRWVERCQRYDDHLEYRDRLRQEKDRREMQKRHAKMGMLAQSYAVRNLEKMVNRTEQDQERVSPGEVARILDVGVKVERLARGEATDSHAVEVSGSQENPVAVNLKVLSDKELDALEALLRKAEHGREK